MSSKRKGFSNIQIEHQLTALGIHEEPLLDAFRSIDRSLFVEPSQRSCAYLDSPLAIGFGQTISQPYIVALMTQLLQVRPDLQVLEIGTGSGYQTAILAFLGTTVWTVEYWEALQQRACAILEELGLSKNVHFVVGDGYEGLATEAPFDRITVTCAPDHIPEPLLEQLADPGIMVIPVGKPGMIQNLWQIKKRDGLVEKKDISRVAFVPMLRKKEEKSQ